MGAPAEEFGPYLVYEQIGIGGMASVHRAETHGIAGFRRTVALKRMLPHVAADANLVKSFVREARLASHLHHTNVAQTFELGKVGETYFMAIELVTGRNLREILRHCAGIAGAMPLPIALNILNQICDALDYAHDLCDETGQPLGIIHRDVSPSNIIVSDGGVVKLIDFGIAKASAAGMQTMSGTIKGKFGYMAPEYIAGKIDARVDLFALGVIAHELLANRPLFQGRDDMDTLHRVRGMKLDPPSKFNAGIPFEIDSIVMTALERDPDKRWQRANALRTALTTETRRLGLTVLNNQVVEWVEWAFQQAKPPDTSPSISIEEGTEDLGTPLAPPPAASLMALAKVPVPGSVRHDDDFEPDEQLTIRRPSGPRPIAVEPRRSSQQPVEPGPRRSAQQPVEPGPRRSSQQPVEPGPRRSAQQPVAATSRRSAPQAVESTSRRSAQQAAEASGRRLVSPGEPAPRRSAQAPSQPVAPARASTPGEGDGLGDGLAHLEDKSGVTTSPLHGVKVPAAPATSPATRPPAPRSAVWRGLLLAVLMLLAAAATATLVYFVLPYFT